MGMAMSAVEALQKKVFGCRELCKKAKVWKCTMQW